MPLEVVRRNNSLEAAAVEAIREAILDGTFPPGMQLKQSLLAERLGLSQGPIREALARLGEEGLVENLPYRGSFVARLTEVDIREIYQMRTALEVLAASLGLHHFQDQQVIETFEGLIDAILEAMKNGDRNEIVLADLAFHRYLVELGNNSRLIKVWDSLLAQARYVLLGLYELEVNNLTHTLAINHREVVPALQSGNMERIRQVIETHMDFAVTTLLENWQQVNQAWQDDSDTV